MSAAMNNIIIRDGFTKATIFLIEEKFIKHDVIHFLKKQPIVDYDAILREERQLEALIQKIARFSRLSTSLLVKRSSIEKNPFLLCPDDILWPSDVEDVTSDDLNFMRVINQYCTAHARPMCGCYRIPQLKR